MSVRPRRDAPARRQPAAAGRAGRRGSAAIRRVPAAAPAEPRTPARTPAPAAARAGFELLVDGPAFWSRLAADLASARRRVFAQTLSFEADRAGRPFADALIASRAPDRRVVVDEFTRHVVNDKFLLHPRTLVEPELRREVKETERMMADLGRAGVGVRFTNPVGWCYLQFPVRNHKKLIAIDGHVLYIGGINFSEHNFEWHDFMLRIEDPALTAFIEADFEATWRGVNQDLVGRFPGLEFHVLDGRSNERHFETVLELLRAARRTIFVQSPYVAAPFSEALREASLRGVRVVVITGEEHNWPLCHDHIHWKAATSPLEVRLYPGRMTHMKAMLIDGATLVVGSTNFELWSYRFQQEYLCLVTDPALIAAFRSQVVEPDLAASRPSPRRVGALRGRVTDMMLEWLERISLRANGRRYV